MKKVITICLILTFSLFLKVGIGQAYTTYFGFDSSFDFSHVNGFGFDIIGASSDDLTLEVYYQDQDPIDIGGEKAPPAVPPMLGPSYPWDFFFTTNNGVPGVTGFDSSFGNMPLKPGVVLSLTGTETFSLDNFILADNSDPEGIFRTPFFVQADIGEKEAAYALTTVPIPGAVWLLGSGLIGLVGFARRKRQ